MLLAKIKEKLFNRRNTVEVEEIKGDINLDGDIKAKNVVNTYIVSNIKAISGEILSSLKAGDIVQKEDSSGKHSYIVSFKKDGTGICLTYTDASVVETQSYDYTEGHWVYNSEDKTPLIKTIESGTISNILGLDSEGKEVKQTAKDVVMNGVKQASAGTIVDSIGLDANGDVVKGQAGGGGKRYLHTITYSPSGGVTKSIRIVNSSPDLLDTVTKILTSGLYPGNSIMVPGPYVGSVQIFKPVLSLYKDGGTDSYYLICANNASSPAFEREQYVRDTLTYTDTVTEL